MVGQTHKQIIHIHTSTQTCIYTLTHTDRHTVDLNRTDGQTDRQIHQPINASGNEATYATYRPEQASLPVSESFFTLLSGSTSISASGDVTPTNDRGRSVLVYGFENDRQAAPVASLLATLD